MGLRPERRAELVAMLEAQHTLEDVVRRVLLAGRTVQGIADPPKAGRVSVVVQDEYTHDVIVPFGEHFLVYDTT